VEDSQTRVPVKSLTLFVAALCCGCSSYGLFGTARVLQPGKFQPYVAPQISGAVSPKGAAVLPQFELGARYGVADGWDLGARFWYAGAAFEARRQLLLSTGRWRPDLSLLGQLSFSAPNTGGVQVAFLIGLPLHDRVQLVIAPRIVYEMWLRPNPARRPLMAMLLGTSVGVAFTLHQRLTLIPEATLVFPAAIESGLAVPAGQGASLQAGVAVLF